MCYFWDIVHKLPSVTSLLSDVLGRDRRGSIELWSGILHSGLNGTPASQENRIFRTKHPSPQFLLKVRTWRLCIPTDSPSGSAY